MSACAEVCICLLYLTHVVFSSRRMADLTLSDALTDSVPVEENIVERDFMATLEAETFEDKVGETVGKADYIPLLDDDEKGELQTRPGHRKMLRPNIPTFTGLRCTLFDHCLIDLHTVSVRSC